MSAGMASRRPGISNRELIAPELDRLTPWLERATERLPLFAKAGLKSVISGAITHTPDGVYLSGPAPGPKNYWMHCGASIGICQGGGAGKYLGAMDGAWPGRDQHARIRSAPFRQLGEQGLHRRSLGRRLSPHVLLLQARPSSTRSAANLRTSSLHEKLKARGGQFQQIFGWERARWYDTSGKGEQFSYKRSNWWEAVKAEATGGARSASASWTFRPSPSSTSTGPDAHAFLDRICANKIPTKDGGIILGHLLNENGFIESEMTVTRLGAETVLRALRRRRSALRQGPARMAQKARRARDDHRHHR